MSIDKASKEDIKILLKSLKEEDKDEFITNNQKAFNYGALEEFGVKDNHFEEDGQIISRKTIEKAIADGEAYEVMLDGIVVGGVVVRVKENHGSLELLFVSPDCHSRGIGYATWCAIERLYPDVIIWETVTPYFEKRNIHFYVNRCGFHIVEFFNRYHRNPNAGKNDDDKNGEMFRFVKCMKSNGLSSKNYRKINEKC
ncbi:MAG: GNAT family N-acetyltransferase [Methanosphaera sp.]|nr:GNAT family N-acetyltransferase [Methanosphaera sp.]